MGLSQKPRRTDFILVLGLNNIFVYNLVIKLLYSCLVFPYNPKIMYFAKIKPNICHFRSSLRLQSGIYLEKHSFYREFAQFEGGLTRAHIFLIIASNCLKIVPLSCKFNEEYHFGQKSQLLFYAFDKLPWKQGAVGPKI